MIHGQHLTVIPKSHVPIQRQLSCIVRVRVREGGEREGRFRKTREHEHARAHTENAQTRAHTHARTLTRTHAAHTYTHACTKKDSHRSSNQP